MSAEEVREERQLEVEYLKNKIFVERVPDSLFKAMIGKELTNVRWV